MGTHDILVAPVVVAAVAFVASWWQPTALIVITVMAGLAQVALDPVIPGNQKHPLVNFAGSLLVAGVVAAYRVDVWWLPVALAGGWVVHIVGDAVTVSGVPVPFAWLAPGPRRAVPSWGFRWFRTGGRFESLVVAPCVNVASAVVAFAVVTHAIR